MTGNSGSPTQLLIRQQGCGLLRQAPPRMIDGMSTEAVVEKTWRMLLERHPDARRGDPEVIEAAFAEPRLRQLFPFPSHGCLNFHRKLTSHGATTFPA